MYLITNNYTRNAQYLLIAFAFFLPVYTAASQAIAFLYLMLWLSNKKYKLIKEVFNIPFNVFSIGYFLLILLSGVYSQNLAQWGAIIDSKLALLLFPILFTDKQIIDNKILLKIIWSFCIACFIAILYIFLRFQIEIPFSSFRAAVSYYTKFNVIYFSMYICFAVSFVIWQITTKKLSKEIITLSTILLITLVVALFAIASRMAILSLFFLAIIILLKVVNYRNIKVVAFVVSLFVLSVYSIYHSSPTLQYRVNQTLNKNNKEPREYIWKASLNAIKKQPILGCGAGDSRDVLLQEYADMQFDYGLRAKYNCHNQYLESWLGGGILALILYTLWWFSGIFLSIKSNNLLGLIFSFIVASNTLTESMLERQQGSFFILFFATLIFVSTYYEEKIKLESSN